MVESAHCNYHFTWRSLHGCPVCTEMDYTSTLSECSLKGTRTVEFHWREPQRYIVMAYMAMAYIVMASSFTGGSHGGAHVCAHVYTHVYIHCRCNPTVVRLPSSIEQKCEVVPVFKCAMDITI